jgi:hypothetical protein
MDAEAEGVFSFAAAFFAVTGFAGAAGSVAVTSNL